MTFAKASKLFLICASAIVLSGCWISFYDAGYYAPCSGAIYVYVAPPPPRYAIPPRPVATAVWIGGYWSWTRRAYDWVDGFWRHNPPHNKRWRPGEWRQSKRGWYWDAGTLALILACQLFFLRPKAPNF